MVRGPCAFRACLSKGELSMFKRFFFGCGVVVTATLLACSQGQSPTTAAPEAPVYGTSTGALGCDEYVNLAKACVDKGRMGPMVKGRNELEIVQNSLRNFVAGAPVALEPRAVWASAVRSAHLQKSLQKRSQDLLENRELEVEKRDVVIDAIPPGELCKHAIDQLPTECQ